MTPTLDRLARGGVCYDNAYSACPVCVPARRTLMTGMSARGHGIRNNKQAPMPPVTTLAQAFRDAGYQAAAVGKLHVHPQRDRIGFDDVILNEEGRHYEGQQRADDWEMYVTDAGHPGQSQAGGMPQNDYVTRAWHLPEHCHPTNWAVRAMCRTIYRRDERKPAFWYLSFIGPHPPIWPPQAYLDLYRDVPLDEPVIGDWAREDASLPHLARQKRDASTAHGAPPHEGELVRRAFYASLTHIDHQIRLVIGFLRDQGLAENTIIAFTSDHGDMLGEHGLWGKTLFYDMSARVPLIVQPHAGCDRLPIGTHDDRLAELCDVMPTLLDLAGVPIPKSVEGRSLVSQAQREQLYGEYNHAEGATRMLLRGRHKLIYYPLGNRVQLFDRHDDPREMHDLAHDPRCAATRADLERRLADSFYGEDCQWLDDGKLVGLPDRPYQPPVTRDLFTQRSYRFI